MSELESLQTFFLGLISVFAVIGSTFGIFILKKLDCFNNMFSEDRQRISVLEEAKRIHHD